MKISDRTDLGTGSVDRFRARSSWFQITAEPSADWAPNRRRIAHMRCSKQAKTSNEKKWRTRIYTK